MADDSKELQGTGRVAVEAIQRSLPGTADVSRPRLLAGGAMHDSWAVDAAGRELVVRVSPAGRADHDKTRREFEVLRVAHARGIRCPEPIALGVVDSGEDYLLMSRVGGDTNPRQLITSDVYKPMHKTMLSQLAEDLALIHRITPAEVPDAPNLRGPEPGDDALAWHRLACEQMYRNDLLNPHPAIEYAFRWLDGQIARLKPSEQPPCVVHGDFRIGNMLYDERGLTAILDWEGVHVGEPEEDLSWLCTRVWRFGSNALEAGGIGAREDWIAAYERASGRSVDRERVAAWEVLQNIRWCQITMMQARAHLDGHTVSHELAAIGRRFAETELEVLRLCGVERQVRRAG
jgi:aminoglycoside phosphotransferase (APT) family kinase protein